MICIRYWAGARAIAGRAEEAAASGPLPAVLAALGAEHGPGMSRLLGVSVLLLDGEQVDRDAEVDLPDGCVLEVLPPYAGGAR